MHYYSFNIKDYAYDTHHLSLPEHGALRLLIDRTYLTEKPLDSNEDNLFKLMCIETAEDKEIIRCMLNEFFAKKRNGWVYKQSETDVRLYKSRSDLAKRAANARWGKGSHADAMPTNNLKLKNINQEPKNITSLETESLLKTFQAFLDKYPRRSNLNEAKQLWLEKKPDIDLVLKALKWQINSTQWRNENGRYIPNPAKYISEQRWEEKNTEPPAGMPPDMLRRALG